MLQPLSSPSGNSFPASINSQSHSIKLNLSPSFPPNTTASLPSLLVISILASFIIKPFTSVNAIYLNEPSLELNLPCSWASNVPENESSISGASRASSLITLFSLSIVSPGSISNLAQFM